MKYYNTLIFFIFWFLTLTPCLAQDTYEKSIIESYKEMQKVNLMNSDELDSEMIIKYTYPPYIDLIGGKEKYIELITTMMEMPDEEEEEYYDEEFEADDEYSVQETRKEIGLYGKVYDTGDELQAIVEIKEIEIFSNRKDIYATYDLAISRDGGKSWYFLGDTQWDKIVPNLHPDISKPEEKEETIIK